MDPFMFDDQGGGEGGYDDFNDDDNNDDYGGEEDVEEDEEQRERNELAKRLEDVLNEDLHGSQSQYSMNSQGVRPNSYEAICRRHIENFMSGAEQYARCVFTCSYNSLSHAFLTYSTNSQRNPTVSSRV
jgi:hypothetical protein